VNDVEVTVYRSVKRADTYVYLPETADYDELPETLRTHFGEAEAFLTFKLTATRHLAQADPAVVLEAIATQGFYLQLTSKDLLAGSESLS
jgi:uncharacterized protein YcgL (UPF0745 family)